MWTSYTEIVEIITNSLLLLSQKCLLLPMAICKCSKSKVTEKDGLLQMESALIYQAVQKFIEQQYKNDWFAYFLAPKKGWGA